MLHVRCTTFQYDRFQDGYFVVDDYNAAQSHKDQNDYMIPVAQDADPLRLPPFKYFG